MALEIRMFGGLELTLPDGSAPVLPTRKAAALLAVLAVDPGREHSRDALAALLWPSSGEAQARASLRQCLAQLRKAIAAPGVTGIVSRGSRLRLDPGGVVADVAELAALPPGAGVDVLAAAVRRISGDFLHGFAPLEDPFDAWVRDQRVRIAEVAAAAIGAALAACLAARRIDDGLEIAERGLALDPTREAFYLAAMRLHLAAGRRSEAARIHERCRRVLDERLGVPPSDAISRLRREIETPAPLAGTPGGRSVAVLPFDNLSPDPDQRFLADGIAEDILTDLSRFRSLAVTARNSSFAYRGHATPIRDIGRELRVDYVLEGSVRRVGAQLRVTAQLIDTRDETHVWADRFDVPLDDVFEVQDDITRAVVGALALRIDDDRLERTRSRRPEDLQAYECWLRGLELVRRGNPESDAQARTFFERAVELEPTFARGYAGISLSHFNDWSCQAWDRWDERERAAFEYARRAVELDDADHVTHCILGRVYAYRREFTLAGKHLERALALNPNDADCLVHVALGKVQLGEHELARELTETAFRLNPRHGDWYYAAATYPLFMLERYEEALGRAEHAPEAMVDTHGFMAAAHAILGRPEEAREHAALLVDVFRRKITFGREPEPGEPLRWLLQVNPFKHERDTRHVREGFAKAGLG